MTDTALPAPTTVAPGVLAPDIPEIGPGIADLLEWRATNEPELPFVRCSDKWRTFAEVEAAAERVARGFAKLGVKKGDRIGVVSDNRDELFDVFFACAKMGAIEVSFNTFLKGDFLSYQVVDADLEVIVVDTPGASALAAITDQVKVPNVALLDASSSEAFSGSRVVGFSELANEEAERDCCEIDAADTLAILYTSGTTGAPKGCMLPHGYFRYAPTQYYQDERIVPGDMLFASYPFFHTSAQVYALMLALYGPSTLRLTKQFSASRFMKHAKEEGATRLLGVAAMGLAILAQPEQEGESDPGTIRSAFWVPFSEADQLAFETRFGTPTFGEGFGQTECMPICHAPAHGPRKRGSNGVPVPYFDFALLDDDGNEVPVGTVGEIAVRPKLPNIMYSGYWRKPEATIENMKHYWHHTGDYARLDEDGYVYFVDRKKQALRRRGENISSLELEAAICKHPAIREAAVHAVPSTMGEDDVKAVLILLEGEQQPDLKDLFEFFKGALPYFAVPRYVEFREALPVNALGRVMKHVLKDEGVTESTWDFEALGFVISRDERR